MQLPKMRSVGLAALALCATLSLSGCPDPSSTETVEVIQELQSPEGEFVATSFYCEGGGAAGYCFYNVSLRRAGEKLDTRDTLLGKYKTWNSFSNIEIQWADGRSLEVSYVPTTSPLHREQIAERTDSKYGVTVHYTVEG